MSPRIRSSDPPPKLSPKYRERVAQLDALLAGTADQKLSVEALMAHFGITEDDALRLRTDYDRLHPGAKTVEKVRYVVRRPSA